MRMCHVFTFQSTWSQWDTRGHWFKCNPIKLIKGKREQWMKPLCVWGFLRRGGSYPPPSPPEAKWSNPFRRGWENTSGTWGKNVLISAANFYTVLFFLHFSVILSLSDNLRFHGHSQRVSKERRTLLKRNFNPHIPSKRFEMAMDYWTYNI